MGGQLWRSRKETIEQLPTPFTATIQSRQIRPGFSQSIQLGGVRENGNLVAQGLPGFDSSFD